MTRNVAFWADLERDLQDPEFRRTYVLESMRISTIDNLVEAFDQARERAGITKADLARAIGAEPASMRRLFSADAPNPTIGTLTDIATALGLRITVEPLPESEQRVIVQALTDDSQLKPSVLARHLERHRSAV